MKRVERELQATAQEQIIQLVQDSDEDSLPDAGDEDDTGFEAARAAAMKRKYGY